MNMNDEIGAHPRLQVCNVGLVEPTLAQWLDNSTYD